jgi:aldehyde dehydrogenase (NAD+)
MTFRTPAESVALANNTPYGLAASVWTENINLALDIAPQIKAGVVWVNCTNLFDASSGFGGYKESGFGREGGREGMWEYLTREPGTGSREPGRLTSRSPKLPNKAAPGTLPAIDRTPKHFIGGKQARPDSGYTRRILTAKGEQLGEVPEGNRKDIRNAVEAARGAQAAWGRTTGHARAQILYYLAENLEPRRAVFAERIRAMTGVAARDAAAEVDATIARLFTYAAWADKWDGAVHNVPIRGIALAMNEPLGVIGVVAPEERPLLGVISLIAPAIAAGNTVIAVPSEAHPLAATDFYSVLETSDVPAGVVNIVTGPKNTLATVLAEHDDVDSVWYAGTREGATAVEQASVGNLKRTWTSWKPRDWMDPQRGEGREFLRESCQVKNIWVPYGE